eukprot:RCo016666
MKSRLLRAVISAALLCSVVFGNIILFLGVLRLPSSPSDGFVDQRSRASADSLQFDQVEGLHAVLDSTQEFPKEAENNLDSTHGAGVGWHEVVAVDDSSMPAPRACHTLLHHPQRGEV